MDDDGRWIDSNLILRELQAPQTSRAQLRQWCLLLVNEKAWWHNKQCGLAPSSIHGRAAIVALLLLCEVSAAPRPAAVEAARAQGKDD